MTTIHMRGGSWLYIAQYLRCTRRTAYDPGSRNSILGFRPVAKAIPLHILHILRGGSWLLTAQHMRCADRNAVGPSNHNKDLGFRPVAKAKP
jgi:formylglycine-generating enzyme required for sulfatase activity